MGYKRNFNSTAADVDALFFEHAQHALDQLPAGEKLRFVFYAHGGLVSEEHGLQQAQGHIDWWGLSAQQGIYPVYFVWKTGLAETIGQILRGAFDGGTKDLQSRELFTDPFIASLARRLGGEGLWSGMKRDAEQAMLPNGVGTYVAKKLKEFCDKNVGRVELHAVGHSAGAVFHSHFVPAVTGTGNPDFITTSFMAPAVRVDVFLDSLTNGANVLPAAGKLTLFTMKKDWERQDNCAGIYRQSLLYLIFHAFEPDDKTPLLGLEESIRADQRLLAIFGLSGSTSTGHEVIWSKTVSTFGRSSSQAVHHGDFSSDGSSLDSILRRVLNLKDTDPIHPFPPAADRGMDSIWDPPEGLPVFRVASVPAATPAQQSLPVTSASGVRKALCVGINAYAAPNTLKGCVNDAEDWSRVLQTNGFATTILRDGEATFDEITKGMRSLVQSSKAGDVLVFQYSGHGTILHDDTGRTIDGFEEAMVPVDFDTANPKLLMDFDIASIFNSLPSGVNLTCFIDCCHSGDITRMFVETQPPKFFGSDQRARFITLTAEQDAAVKSYRATQPMGARGLTIGGTANMRNIAFSACMSHQVAMESDGHGAFTTIAIRLLMRGFSGWTNRLFLDTVIATFGPDAGQTPVLDCAPPAMALPLLGTVS